MRHGFAVSRIRVIYNSLLKRGHMGIKVRLIEELRVPLLSNLRIVPSLQDILNQRSVMLELQKET